jgi:hypothetical protein
MLRALRLLSPSTVSVVAPVLLGIPPQRAETLTPAQARERYELLPPAAEYAGFRALVDAKTAAGSDASGEVGPEIAESQAILGPVAA